MAYQRKSVRGEFVLLLIVIVGAFTVVPAVLSCAQPPVSRSSPAAGSKVVLQEDYGVLYAGAKPAGNGDMAFAFGDECWVQHDGTLTVLCGDADGVLAGYARPRDDAFGSLCPVNAVVYIDAPLWQRLQDEKAWLARTRTVMKRLAKICGR